MSFRFIKFNNPPKFSATKFLNNLNNRPPSYNKTLPINTVNSFQITQNLEENNQITKNLLEKNLETEISSNENVNSEILKQIIPLMLTYNSFFSEEEEDNSNPFKENKNKSTNNYIEYSNIITCFQLLIKFLYETKENVASNNLNKENNLNEMKGQSKISNNENIISSNENKINILLAKKLKLESFLKANGHSNYLNTNNIYFCDVCPYKKFSCYKDFHHHYVKNHINPYNVGDDGKLINVENGFDKIYFDNKINELTDEIKEFMRTNVSQKKQRIDKDFEEMQKSTHILLNFNKRNNTTTNLYKLNRHVTDPYIKNERKETNESFNPDISRDEKKVVNDLIIERINKIKKNQKNYEEFFEKQLNNFMLEFKNQLSQLKKNK